LQSQGDPENAHAKVREYEAKLDAKVSLTCYLLDLMHECCAGSRGQEEEHCWWLCCWRLQTWCGRWGPYGWLRAWLDRKCCCRFSGSEKLIA
jgi:hypothetical protein